MRSTRAVRIWLWIVIALVFCMVVLGGATRLTDSGLSITEWQPVMGLIPPLSDLDWQVAFSKYQEIPEYRTQNLGMSLAEFKQIFWWEWAHRILGRFIGVVLILPMLVFLATRRLSTKLGLRLLAIFLLGGAQAALGWFMVQSGLQDRVDVSQYRLAAHLALAAIIFASLVWTVLGLERDRRWQSRKGSAGAMLLVLMIIAQMIAGGFVAGLDAGMGYSTWPKMDGYWVPPGLLAIEPMWRNFFENAMTVQLVHRMIAYLVAIVAIIHAWRSFSISALIVAYAVFIQIGLGVFTLVMQVPLALGLAHQAFAMLLLGTAVWHLHRKTVVVPGLSMQA